MAPKSKVLHCILHKVTNTILQTEKININKTPTIYNMISIYSFELVLYCMHANVEFFFISMTAFDRLPQKILLYIARAPLFYITIHVH